MSGAPPRAGLEPGAVLTVVVFLALMAGVLVGVNLVGIVVLLAVETGGDPTNLMGTLARLLDQVREQQIPGWYIGFMMTLQFPAMLASTRLATVVVDSAWYASRGGGPERDWREVFALRRADGAFMAVALLMGFTTGWFPGWMAAWMREFFDLGDGSLELITSVLTSGPIVWRVYAGLWIALGAALVEEMIFRGFLWDTLERAGLRPGAVWIVTSLLFAANHLDPVQSTALVFTALTLGWLRMTSGSLLPCVLVHAVNNSLGVAAAWLGLEDGEMDLGVALLGLGITLALWAVAWRLRASEAAR